MMFSLFSRYADSNRCGKRRCRAERRKKRSLLASETLEPRQLLSVTLNPIGRYATGIFDQAAAEAVGYNVAAERIFIGNQAPFTPGDPDSSYVPDCVGDPGDPGDPDADPPIPPTPPTPAEPCAFGRIDVVDASDPTDLGPDKKLFSIDVSQYGMPTSISSHGDLIAVAIPNGDDATMSGVVTFFDATDKKPKKPVKVVEVGVLPDMVTFSPDGKKVITANEGQPCEADDPADCAVSDPEGSISIIDLSRGVRRAHEELVTFNAYDGQEASLNARGVRVLSDRPASQSIEPEYVTVDPTSRFAWVTLQENNAIAQVNLRSGTIEWIKGLGTKDHALPGNELDPSDKDGGIHIENWPVQGLYQPDGLTVFATDDGLFLATANEGDNFVDEGGRLADLVLDETAFPNAADLQAPAALGRLNVSATFGDTDGDGDVDVLNSFGARSFTIWTPDGDLVYDSGDDFEQITAAAYPDNFNASNTNNTLDNRSDDKGPEPTTVAVAKVDGRSYAVITIERTGGLMVYDVTRPSSPLFVQYVNTRDFSIDPEEAGETTDLHPENVTIVSASDSPTGKTLVIVSYQVSGSAVVFEFSSTDEGGHGHGHHRRRNDDDRHDRRDDDDHDWDRSSSYSPSALVVRAGASSSSADAPRTVVDRSTTRRAALAVGESPTRRLAATDRVLATQHDETGASRSLLYASRAARPDVEAAVSSLSNNLTRARVR